ncbi:choice-of-anchor Y domain-containing protein [Tolypothrix sp. VBCCA 56010]|uniref:choice-of-anchor Y domain-containing protein n=1 Tax=Tolypothrix sp. VBCCA 56010 TaxID=3137731 RepID=UPI003D7C5FE9
MSISLFDANVYRAANSDLAAAGLTTDAQLLSHFQTFGIDEGRTFSRLIDLNFYRASNEDLASSGLTSNRQVFEHLQQFGVAEGRQFSAFVNLNFYRASNSDLATFNNEQLFEHFRNFGLNEERIFSDFFDISYYKNNNQDLVSVGLKGQDLLEHFQKYGLAEGRQFSTTFDVNYYRSLYSDFSAANLNNRQLYEHFQLYGLTEGRASSSSFNIKVYLANNSDLVAAKLNNQQAYQHFLVYGQKEGRPGSDYAGNTLDKARSFTFSLDSNVTFTDFVGSNDSNDYYRVTLDNLSNFSLKLDNLSDNANVQVLGSDGSTVITESLNIRTRAESFVGGVNAGTYYIRVFSTGNSNTNYNLSLSSTSPQENAFNGDLTNQVFNNQRTSVAKSLSLYNGASAGTPNQQGYLAFEVLPSGSSTQSSITNGTKLTSIQNGLAGYSNYNSLQPTLVNSSFPTLNRTNGFTINFQVKLNSESHSSDNNKDGLIDRAGFSVIAIGNDKKGIELGFWTDEIWAQESNPLFTHSKTERKTFDTTTFKSYELSVLGDTYKLSANGSGILTGKVKDYSAFNHAGTLPYDPYETPNFLFFGDNTTSAKAEIELKSISVVAA